MKSDFFILTFLTVVFLSSCRSSNDSEQRVSIHVDSPDMSEVVVNLPAKDGKALVERSCVPCHSLRYIEMQPVMNHKSWEKIVTKMIKNFGAPVRDSVEAAAIVDYLAAIKGSD